MKKQVFQFEACSPEFFVVMISTAAVLVGDLIYLDANQTLSPLLEDFGAVLIAGGMLLLFYLLKKMMVTAVEIQVNVNGLEIFQKRSPLGFNKELNMWVNWLQIEDWEFQRADPTIFPPKMKFFKLKLTDGEVLTIYPFYTVSEPVEYIKFEKAFFDAAELSGKFKV